MQIHTTKYEEALCPKTFDICGWVLKPFSLGIYCLLERINSPVVNENVDLTYTMGLSKEQQIQKLLYLFDAVFLCSLGYDLGNKALNDDELFNKLRDQFDKGLIESMEMGWNWCFELYKFKQYIKYFMDIPLFERIGKQSQKASGSDWKKTIFVMFKGLSYSESEILNMPLKRLFDEWTTQAESAGGIRVKNKEELEQKPAVITITENVITP